MTAKIISNAGSNEAGAWVYYSDGSSIKYVASLNITIVDDGYNPIPETHTGRKFI
jgi:hypothetical protein